MTKRVIFNPLDGVSVASAGQESTSSLINVDVGVCPKCSTVMTDGKIANADVVYYCDACRVSTPKPDSL
jgi:hydrogenase maturation factor HypF (carbamoyltransferase family)